MHSFLKMLPHELFSTNFLKFTEKHEMIPIKVLNAIILSKGGSEIALQAKNKRITQTLYLQP